MVIMVEKKKILAGLGIVTGALVTSELLLSSLLLKYAVSRHSSSSKRTIKRKKGDEANASDSKIPCKDPSARAAYDSEHALGKAWHETVENAILLITAQDGIHLMGELFMQDQNNQRYVILVHGYKEDSSTMYHYARHYWQKGYNVLLPDLRACGKSEGDYLGMGWLDRRDLLSWIHHLLSHSPDAEIVLHGKSMGAATVMMASGEEALPSNVKAVIEDSGYTSVYDIFNAELHVRFGLPSFPLMNTASIISHYKANYHFQEASAVKQVAKSHTPTLFIHGTGDNFVPYAMHKPLYEACSAPKGQYVVEGAEHGCSVFYDVEKYYGTVFGFIERYV